MNGSDELKRIVIDKYGAIIKQSYQVDTFSGCCKCGPNPDEVFTMIADEYNNIPGYVPEANLGLGCGIPTEFANIKEGFTVVDLGSGAGNDSFIASQLVGPSGRVIGIDMTQEMIDKANENKEKLNIKNVEFLLGDIENLPLESVIADVVISNCVLNLVPDKFKAFDEIYRITKSFGRLCLSDLVLNGPLPKKLREAAEFYAMCVSGAMLKAEYLSLISSSGFEDISIVKKKIIDIPTKILKNYLDQEEIWGYKNDNKNLIESVTIVAIK